MIAKAEYLKHVVQEVMSAFQQGAGLADGIPAPMTYELAVRRIWLEIDRAFTLEGDEVGPNFVTMRVQGKCTLHDMLNVLRRSGEWRVRGTAWRVADGTVVLHVAGNPTCEAVELFDGLARAGFQVTDFTVGLSGSVS